MEDLKLKPSQLGLIICAVLRPVRSEVELKVLDIFTCTLQNHIKYLSIWDTGILRPYESKCTITAWASQPRAETELLVSVHMVGT